MPRAMRAFVLMPLVTIAYVVTSVYFYGKGMTSGGHPLSQNCFTLFWFPLVAFNAWAMGSAFPAGGSMAAKWFLAVVTAIMLSVAAMLMFMSIAFNAYGS
jgi:hypothetical protein